MSLIERQRIAALPMYDFPELRESHDELWAALASRLVAAGVANVPPLLTQSLGHVDVWRHRRLLLGQGCEYPLATSLAGAVRIVATPCYTALGCVGGHVSKRDCRACKRSGRVACGPEKPALCRQRG